MIFVFWQDIISPHQIPFISKIPFLPGDHKVILVVSKHIQSRRQEMGWETNIQDQDTDLQIEIGPNEQKIKSIIKDNLNAQHFFSGIRPNPMVFSAFKISLNYKLNRHLIVEGPNYFRKPKILHLLRTFFFDYKYFKYVQKVFAIGEDAREWYKIWGFEKKQIVPFSYCVENYDLDPHPSNGTAKFLYVGSLIKLKGVDVLIESFNRLSEDYQLDIIGKGKESTFLKRLANNGPKKEEINFLGVRSNTEVRELLVNYDCLVLPSHYDGWGAVINEGLMSGLFIICSDQCGAKDLIIPEKNGLIFSHKKNDLCKKIEYVLDNKDSIREHSQKIKEWSSCIEGSTMAKYFVHSIKTQEKMTPPWKTTLIK